RSGRAPAPRTAGGPSPGPRAAPTRPDRPWPGTARPARTPGSPPRAGRSAAPAAVQPPLHRLLRDAEHVGGLRLRHPVDPHEVEALSLVLRQLVDRREHAAAVRGETEGAVGRRRHQPLAQLRCGWLTI